MYETKKEKNERLFPSHQSWNLNLFSDYYIEFWKTRKPVQHYIADVSNSNIKAHFGGNGVASQNSIGIYIDTYNHPIGILSLYYAEEHSPDSTSNKYLEDAAGAISKALGVKHDER